jgi:peptide/nickel transport system substrate-binding protein
LTTTGSALASAATLALSSQTDAKKRHLSRGGVLRFATRSEAAGLDPHRNIVYLVSQPLAATTQGLLDLNLRSELVPGIASEWDVSADLRTYTFRLRKGVLFHNGRRVDAAAVKWNFLRMQNPQKSHAFTRAALGNLREIIALDRYTVRCHLHEPSATFPSNVVYYPCNLIAPDSEAQIDTHPIGCGPFKFVKWERNQITELARFENYFETDAEGHALPYLDKLIGRPIQEDRRRLAALRSGEVDLIDTMAYADAADFLQRYTKTFRTWHVPTLGTAFILFNLDNGPFATTALRHAAAHAIDRDAVKRTVFYGRGSTATGYYSADSPWHMPGVTPPPAYDPDKARFLLRQARAIGTTIDLQSPSSYPYMRQIGELLQTMWTEVGFHVTHNTYESPVLRKKRQNRDFHAAVAAASYRFDPDGWFSRSMLSTAPSTQTTSGFRHPEVDKLIIAARQTAAPSQRIALYTAIESLINAELPVLYLHHLTLLEAGVPHLHGYQPAISGAFSTRGAGIRTAWLT